MSSSQGGSKSEGRQTTKPSRTSKELQKQTAAATVPVLQEQSRQIFEALTTGGVGARLPIAQQGVEATQAATSQTVDQTRDNFARAGINPQDPFALETLGNMQLQGAQQAANIPVALARALQDLAANFGLGAANLVVQGGQVSRGNQSSKSAEQASEYNLI